jgi:hypothetical protein
MLARLASRPEFMLYALFALTNVCALVLFALPRALAPNEPPPLVLDRASVDAVLAADRAASARAPDTKAAQALDSAFLELGAAEDGGEAGEVLMRRKQSLARIYARFVLDAGEPAALALRARSLERFEAALALRLSDAETKRVLGLFPEAAARYRALRDGLPVAPHLVLRTLYKVRWNLAMGLAPDYALAATEHRAYYGWLALHADNLDPVARSAALAQYGRAGGTHVAEAKGVLAFLEHDYTLAVAALTEAQRETPSLRIRNWLRGAMVAEQAGREAP